MASTLAERFEIPIAGGQVKQLDLRQRNVAVDLADGDGDEWRVLFRGVAGFEFFGIEGEELDRVECAEGGDLVDRCRDMSEKPLVKAECHSFFATCSDQPLMRIVAESCDARKK